VDDALARLGLERHIAVAIPHFLVMPHIIAQTDLVLTVASRVAHAFARALPIRTFPPPLDLARFEIRMFWHERSHLEPAHVWLRDTMARLALQFATEAPATP
jgi:DNA-binding transcriptional LysR family regulator